MNIYDQLLVINNLPYLPNKQFPKNLACRDILEKNHFILNRLKKKYILVTNNLFNITAILLWKQYFGLYGHQRKKPFQVYFNMSTFLNF